MARHAKFPPSSLSRTILCPASWLEGHLRPKPPTSSFAQHGTLLHEYVVRTYDKGPKTVRELSKEADRHHVLTCINYINDLKRTCYKDQYELSLERKVSLSKLGLPDIWGTADVVLYDKFKSIVHVVDWKFGKGVKVYANRNNQGLAYLGGAAMLYPEAEHFKFHLVQPPLHHEGIYEIEREDLIDYVENVFKLAVIKATKEDPEYTPSDEACRWCVAKQDCKARYNLAVDNAKQVTSLKSTDRIISEDDVKAFLKIAPMLEKYIKELRAYAETLLKEGEAVEGFKLVYGRSMRKHIDQKATVKWVLDNTYIDHDELFEKKLLSPAKLEALDDTLVSNEDFQNLISITKGKLKVVEESDPRPAQNVVRSAKVAFANYIKSKGST